MNLWTRAKVWAAQKLLNSVVKGYGDRTIARIMLAQGLNYAWPGGWSADRIEQIKHFRHWVYVAVRAIMDSAGNSRPNIDYVSAANKGVRNKVWWKSANRILPSDKVEPTEEDHPIRALFNRPNQMDSYFDFASELAMFIKLTGNGFIWMVPNQMGYPCELWVIPSHWMWIIPGKDRYVDWYELRPWTSYTGAPSLRIPPRDVIHIRCKSPITKIDGFATTKALDQVIDVYDSMLTRQWADFKNGVVSSMVVKLGPQYGDPTDGEMERIYEKFFWRFQGELMAGLPMLVPPGSDVTNLTFSPKEMLYNDSDDKVRDKILAGYGVPKSVVGLFDEIPRANVDGALVAFGHFTMNPYNCMVGEKLTHGLASRFEHGRKIKIWWPDASPVDPGQQNDDLRTWMELGLLNTNEGRARIGYPPWRRGGNNPMIQSGFREWPANDERLVEPREQQERSFDDMAPLPGGGGGRPFPAVPSGNGTNGKQ